ncbi:MAG TPA: hypothetical protein VIN35_00545 [Hydrogenophaga sp.]
MKQGAILLYYLRQHGRKRCSDLERLCDVRSVTTRMTELIRKGRSLVKTTEWEPNSRGKLRRVTFYELVTDPAQSDLFPST